MSRPPTTHEFLDVPQVETGDRVRAQVWFLVPENYPGSLWLGRALKVAEGARDVEGRRCRRCIIPC